MIGREDERKRLLNAFNSEYSEFVAVYGRRRVGKTFLIRESFNYHFFFQHTGVANGTLSEQLDEFRSSLKDHGHKHCPVLHNWFEAFNELKEMIKTGPEGKKIIFIDELSYMDVVGSRFIPALEHFWNGWASARKDILLIVCGSATSWILNKVIHSKGGLHGRITERIRLAPFRLAECEAYAKSLGLVMTHYQIAEMYMVMGGIPYYWKYLQPSLSPAGNIDDIFFAGNDKLENEFEELYASLFKNKKGYMKIVTALALKKIGMTREELSKSTGLSNSGTLTKYLLELEQCGFIRKYAIPGNKVKESVYQLMDNFTLFHFKYIADNAEKDARLWSNSLDTPRHRAWAGLAFERLCLWHAEEIKSALGIGGVQTTCFAWRKSGNQQRKGAQVDMVIDRRDGVVNLCEMKFANSEYEIKSDEDRWIRERREIFREDTKTRKSVHLTYVTTYGLSANAYANDVQSQVVLDDLFRR